MKAETHPDDGVLYWAYILLYVDGILCVHHDPGAPLAKLDDYFKMKECSIQVPTLYLGAKLKTNAPPQWRGCMKHELQQVCAICCTECLRLSGGTPW
jgi:hypothetical protein